MHDGSTRPVRVVHGTCSTAPPAAWIASTITALTSRSGSARAPASTAPAVFAASRAAALPALAEGSHHTPQLRRCAHPRPRGRTSPRCRPCTRPRSLTAAATCQVELDPVLLARGGFPPRPGARRTARRTRRPSCNGRLAVGAVALCCAHIQVLGRTRLASSTSAIRSGRLGACERARGSCVRGRGERRARRAADPAVGAPRRRPGPCPTASSAARSPIDPRSAAPAAHPPTGSASSADPAASSSWSPGRPRRRG